MCWNLYKGQVTTGVGGGRRRAGTPQLSLLPCLLRGTALELGEGMSNLMQEKWYNGGEKSLGDFQGDWAGAAEGSSEA